MNVSSLLLTVTKMTSATVFRLSSRVVYDRNVKNPIRSTINFQSCEAVELYLKSGSRENIWKPDRIAVHKSFQIFSSRNTGVPVRYFQVLFNHMYSLSYASIQI